jgi:hypothetical protein
MELEIGQQENEGDTTTTPKIGCRRFFLYAAICYVQNDNDRMCRRQTAQVGAASSVHL